MMTIPTIQLQQRARMGGLRYEQCGGQEQQTKICVRDEEAFAASTKHHERVMCCGYMRELVKDVWCGGT